jgi:hypothetical protein
MQSRGDLDLDERDTNFWLVQSDVENREHHIKSVKSTPRILFLRRNEPQSCERAGDSVARSGVECRGSREPMPRVVAGEPRGGRRIPAFPSVEFAQRNMVGTVFAIPSVTGGK